MLCWKWILNFSKYAHRDTYIGLFIYFKDFIYLFMRDTEREAETQAEGEAGSMQGAPCGTRSRDPWITTWAKGRC